MKLTGKITYIIVGMILFLSSCVKEEMEGVLTADETLKITVTDGGYISGEPLQGRTATDGFRTTFTNGDLIGVFTVVNGEVKQRNVGMMYSSDVQGWVGLLKKEAEPDAQYYAYYPWRENLKGEVNPKARSAEEFFGKVVEAWELPADQSTYRKYTATDLMIGSGEVTHENQLSFTLSHQMGLVVIEMPVFKYVFQNETPKLRDYVIPAQDTKFEGITPCVMFDGSYRYLIKAGTEKAFSGSYVKDGVSYVFNAVPNLSAGTYKKYKVDGGAATETQHTLQVGDYYMKDGKLVAAGTPLTDDQKKNCLGIVFWIGNPTQTDITLKDEHPNCMHGLVCSLKDGEDVRWQENNLGHHQTVQHWIAETTTGFMDIATGADSDDNMNNIQGYNNTRVMELFNQAPENSSNTLSIVNQLLTFRKSYPTPPFSSGWYIPSVKELFIMMNEDMEDIYHQSPPGSRNYKLLNGLFKNLKGYADLFNSKDIRYKYYFSSSEHNVYKVWCVNAEYSPDEGFGEGSWTTVGENDKGYNYHSRFILAF